MEKSLDKDIEILKEFIKKDYEPWSFYEKQGDELFELQQAIETVLKEFEETQAEVKAKREIDEIINKIKSELETYKKIAERLAILLFKGLEGRYICDVIEKEHCNKYTSDKCIQCIIDWTKNEVLKNE